MIQARYVANTAVMNKVAAVYVATLTLAFVRVISRLSECHMAATNGFSTTTHQTETFSLGC